MLHSLQKRLGKWARRHVPRHIEDLVRRFDWVFEESGYRTAHADPKTGTYKELLGGGAQHWEARGVFQRNLLEKLGVAPAQSVLDVGCGPGRASRFLVEYLDPGCYAGIDYNAEFIEVARKTVQDAGLEGRGAVFETVQNFELSSLGRSFDLLLAFSVLNHCNDRQKASFFAEATRVLNPGGRVVISHARWLSQRYLDRDGLELVRKVDGANPLLTELRPSEYGFADGEFEPIVVLKRRQTPD